MKEKKQHEVERPGPIEAVLLNLVINNYFSGVNNQTGFKLRVIKKIRSVANEVQAIVNRYQGVREKSEALENLLNVGKRTRGVTVLAKKVVMEVIRVAQIHYQPDDYNLVNVMKATHGLACKIQGSIDDLVS